ARARPAAPVGGAGERRWRRWAELASGAGAGARPADATSGELGSSVPSAPRALGTEGILDRRCHATPSRPLAFLRIRKSPNARRHSQPQRTRRPETPDPGAPGTRRRPRARRVMARPGALSRARPAPRLTGGA